jgi:hypothetical protein
MTAPAPQFGEAGYDPAQLAQAAEDLRSAPLTGTPLPGDADMASVLAAKQASAPAGLTSVDIDKLLAGIAKLQARVDALESEKAAGLAVPVTGTAEAMRDLIKTHAAHYPRTDHAAVLALADDTVDAAGNAAQSGDGAVVTQLAARLARALRKVDPGPGDHHYFRQALGFAEVHLPDAAADLKPAQQPAAGAISSDRAPAKVISGSVTG